MVQSANIYHKWRKTKYGPTTLNSRLGVPRFKCQNRFNTGARWLSGATTLIAGVATVIRNSFMLDSLDEISVIIYMSYWPNFTVAYFATALITGATPVIRDSFMLDTLEQVSIINYNNRIEQFYYCLFPELGLDTSKSI